ncbi:hypothetical protein NBRC116495_11000 [Aurantivibrio plasticivorans]
MTSVFAESSLPSSVNYRLLRIATEQFGELPEKLDESQQKQVKDIAAKEYVLEQAVLSSEEARGVQVPESQIMVAIDQIKARYEDEDAFLSALEANYIDLDNLRDSLERELRVEAVLGRVGAKAPEVDDTEVDLYYYMNSDKFEKPETRQARHILITINPDFTENTDESARERLALIRKRLIKNTSRFGEQAMKHSECPSSLQGGVLGELKRGVLFPQLDETLFSMSEGEISEIIESPVGLHILYCEVISPAGMAQRKDIVAKLKEQLQERQRSRYTKQWVQQLIQQGSSLNSTTIGKPETITEP